MRYLIVAAILSLLALTSGAQKKKMACKTCQWLDVGLDKVGRRVVRSSQVHACTVEVPAPVLPVSVRKAYGFKWPPSKAFVSSDDEKDCPLFSELKGKSS